MAKKLKNNEKVNELNTSTKAAKKAQKKEQRGVSVPKIINNNNNNLSRPKGWFRLDNAATIYPSSSKEHWCFVVRISAVLKNKVEPQILQKSIDEIMPRFPTFNVCLRKGIFWHYFEESEMGITVQEEKDFPCYFMEFFNAKQPLIRVLFSDYRISVECFHAVTDGHGLQTFLISLLARYFENLGIKLDPCDKILNCKDLPNDDELKDSFFEFANNEKGKSHREKAAYKIAGTVEDDGIVNTINGVMSVSNVKEIAAKHDAKLTSFLAGCLGYSILQKRKNSKKPVKISLPIDLRNWFGSSTLRNFSSYINIELDENCKSVDDAINIVKKEIAKINKEMLQANINSNVSAQKNWLIKIMPLCVKNLFLNSAFNFLGEKLQTFAFSNLGAMQVPAQFNDLIERFEVNLGRSKHNSISVGLISFNDVMVLTISSKLHENTTAKDFFKLLASLGVRVKVESNRRDEYGR